MPMASLNACLTSCIRPHHDRKSAGPAMNHEEFNRLAAAGYNRIPVSLELFADLDT